MKKLVILSLLLSVSILLTGCIKKSGGSTKSAYPLPNSVKNLTETGENGVNFQSKLSLNEVESFYREKLVEIGLTERTLLTAKTDTTLSFVFDGHSSEMALVVQVVKMDSGTNVNIRLEDL